MLLFLSFLLFCFISHLKIGGRNILHPFPLFSIVRNLFRSYKGFFFGSMITGFLHLAGTLILGNVKYNTSGFDILTHFLMGFFVREAFIKVNLYYPLIDWVKGLFGGKGFIGPTFFSISFFLLHEIQEGIQEFIPLLKEMVSTQPLNQVRDLVMNLLGMTFSLVKDLL